MRAALVAAACLSACTGLKGAAAEATYLGQQLECVDQARTLVESDECRAKVRERWGIVETRADGGAR